MATRNGGEPGPGTEPGPSTEPGGPQSDPSLAPPRLLTRRAEAGALPPPIHDADALVAVRRRWAQISASTGRGAPTDDHGEGATGRGSARAPGVRAKVKARVATAAAGVQAQDRAMTGELVDALEAISRRIDELAERLRDLESLVQETVELTSEELTRVQVALGAGRERPPGV